MAKISELPKASRSNSSDRLTVLQNGQVKTISKKSLLGDLESKLAKLAGQVRTMNKNALSKAVLKNSPSFSVPAKGKPPVSSDHLSTKGYVDQTVAHLLKRDGSNKVTSALAYDSNVSGFGPKDIVPREFVDDELKKTLKKIVSKDGDNGYPSATAGEVILINKDYTQFATDGPEIQAGDILICMSDSLGGTHSEVGSQFAIVNTNIIAASEDKSGIVKKASAEDIQSLSSQETVVTPANLRSAFEATSQYNRKEVSFTTYTLTEEDQGLIGVDSRRNTVTLTLPAIKSLKYPKLVKYRIKDEYKSSVKYPITIKAASSDTIQGSNLFKLSSNGGSVKLYTNGLDRWFIENNLPTDLDSIKVKSVLTDNTTTGEVATTTGTDETLMSIELDLKDYPIGSSFKLVASCFYAADSDNKNVKLKVDGNTLIQSSTVAAAPNGVFGILETTVVHSDTVKTMAYNRASVGTAQTVSVSNNLDIDWDTIITVSVDINNTTTASDVNLYTFQVIPLK